MALRMRQDAKMKLIAKVPLFAGLSKQELSQVAAIADEIDLKQGKALIREGERGREFFVLLDGEVEIRRKGRKLSNAGSGEFFGETALVANVSRTATVTATTPVRALVVTERSFRALLERTPKMAVKVLQAVAERLPAGDS